MGVRRLFSLGLILLAMFFFPAKGWGLVWHTEFVDVNPNIFESYMHRALAIDQNGHPHIAYGGDHLYYAAWNGAGWNIEVVDDSPNVGKYASLALDSQGHPHIAYYDGNNGDLRYAYWDGSQWQIETVDSTGWVGKFTSLALDSQGRPHIAYYDYTHGDLKYAYYDGSSWQIETVGSERGAPNSLALDSQDRPHIAYLRWGGRLMYARFDGTSWQIETVVSGEASEESVSLALDSQGHPHIAYYDGSNDNLKYAYYDGTSWQIETVDSDGDVGKYASLALDASGYPHIAYLDDSNDNLKYAYYDGTSWQIQIVGSERYVGMYASLALDASGYPHIAYFDWSKRDLKYAYYDGISWQIETVDSEGSVGWSSSLAFDSQGRPHIAYFDFSDDNLKYAYYDGISWQIETVDSCYRVCGYASLALDSEGRPHIAYYDNYDLKYAYWDGSQWQIETVESDGDVGKYASLALDASGYPHIAYHKQKYPYYYLYYDYYQVVYPRGWQRKLVEFGGGNEIGLYASLALDSQGRPHIAYYEYYDALYGDLKYAYWDGSQWQIETVDYGDAYASLALDSQGRPHIAYYDHKLKYAYYDGSSWHVETVDPGWKVGKYASLVLDASGRPHIAYYDDSNEDLKYAYWDGSSWQIETVDSEGDVGKYASLALDASGRPHIAYYDQTNGDLKYAYGIPEVQEFTLSVSTEGGGSVTSNPPGISCPDDCSEEYAEGTSVTLTATADEGYAFSGWGGDCADCGSNTTCTVTMDSDKTCSAVFEEAPNQPPEINSFSANPTSGSAPLEVTFTCTAHDPDGEIVQHAIDYDGDGNSDETNTTGSFTHTYTNPGTYNATCTVTDDDGASVTSDPVAINVSVAMHTLSISPEPQHGTVIGTGINCGPEGDDCSEDYAEGSEVTLTATPDEGYLFSGWEGDCAGCEGESCTITMDSDKTCSAVFEEAPNLPPEIESFTVEPTSGFAPLTVDVTCVATDPDGTIVQYAFDPGDGSDPLISQDGTFSYTYNAPGTYQATCTAYDDDEASTTSEPITVEVSSGAITAADLVVTKLVTPRYWRAGKRGRVTVMIENLGEEDVTEPFVVRAVVHSAAPGVIIGEQRVNGLAAGRRKLVRFRFRVPEALCFPTNQHTLYVTVDADDQISETDEGNNTKEKKIIIRGCPSAS